MAYSEKSENPGYCHTLVSDVVGAVRNGLYEGGDYFDNLGGSNYNELI